MSIISVPAEARDKFLTLCKKYNEEKNKKQRERIVLRIRGYKEAINDICGVRSLGLLLIDADLQLPDNDRPSCCGMYLDLDD